MHELSLAHRILDQVLEVASEYPGMALAGACVELGPLSGVEPLLLQSAFQQVVAQRCQEPVDLYIEEVELRARCQACGNLTDIREFVFQCDHCAGRDLDIISGQAVRLMSVDMLERECTQ